MKLTFGQPGNLFDVARTIKHVPQARTAVRSKIGKHVIHRVRQPKTYSRKTGWTYGEEHRDVILLAVSGSWAMVRRPRCVPYCCPLEEILTGSDEP